MNFSVFIVAVGLVGLSSSVAIDKELPGTLLVKESTAPALETVPETLVAVEQPKVVVEKVLDSKVEELPKVEEVVSSQVVPDDLAKDSLVLPFPINKTVKFETAVPLELVKGPVLPFPINDTVSKGEPAELAPLVVKEREIVPSVEELALGSKLELSELREVSDGDAVQKREETLLDIEPNLNSALFGTEILSIPLPSPSPSVDTILPSGEKVTTPLSAVVVEKVSVPVSPVLGEKLSAPVSAILGEKLSAPVSPVLGEKLSAPVSAILGEKLSAPVSAVLGEELSVPVSAVLGEKLSAPVSAILGENLSAPVSEEIPVAASPPLVDTLVSSQEGLLLHGNHTSPHPDRLTVSKPHEEQRLVPVDRIRNIYRNQYGELVRIEVLERNFLKRKEVPYWVKVAPLPYPPRSIITGDAPKVFHSNEKHTSVPVSTMMADSPPQTSAREARNYRYSPYRGRSSPKSRFGGMTRSQMSSPISMSSEDTNECSYEEERAGRCLFWNCRRNFFGEIECF